MIFEKLRPKM